MARTDDSFKTRVYAVVKSIPEGRVMTYGQIALLCGAAWAAWEVGQIAHLGPADLPWHRVVNKKGGLARGYTAGGRDGQKKLLEAENIIVSKDYNIDIDKVIWTPE